MLDMMFKKLALTLICSQSDLRLNLHENSNDPLNYLGINLTLVVLSKLNAKCQADREQLYPLQSVISRLKRMAIIKLRLFSCIIFQWKSKIYFIMFSVVLVRFSANDSLEH